MNGHVCCYGLDYKTAPVATREPLALIGDGLRLALKHLNEQRQPGVQEVVLLSTCNRLELYLVARQVSQARHQFEAFLQDFYGVEPGPIQPQVYELVDDQAVEHLMRVAAGLESMVLGEPQILGQVAQSISKARGQQSAGLILNRLFEQALRVGKRARAETEISRHTTSISHAAALLAAQRLGGLETVQALIIGAGEMAGQAAQALHQRGARHLTCLSRALNHAEALVSPLGGRAVGWLQLPEEMERADLVISAVNAPHFILGIANLAPILPRREKSPLVLIDLGVPRNIEPAIADLNRGANGFSGLELYDLDGLQSIVDEHLTLRQAAIPAIETILAEEGAAFKDWLRSRQVTPTLVALRRKTESIVSAEVDKTLRSLNGVPPETRLALAQLGRSIAQKLLHAPSLCLKTHADSDDAAFYAQAARDLFALETAEYLQIAGDGLETFDE